ncbi:MAG: efflux RND transporter periplasmic adaptor subunit, partial [Acidobacteria bacterium]|nr:efflux RND transporter periplasmic adaptor subunit [Acidobacteriota bacterium]
DLLFVIDPRQYQAAVDQAKAQVEANKASSKLAQTELQISQQLESKEAISALRLEKQSAQRDVTKADVDLAQANLEQANLNLEWTQVTSPINGRISRNLIDVGNLVNSAEKTLLATVVNDDSVYVYFNVSELDLLPIRRLNAETRGSTLADLKIPAFIALADESEFKHEGHLDYGDPRVNPSTGTIQVRGVFPNPDGLLMGGLFVRIRVPVEKKMSLTIPDIAVQVDQGGSFVYVLSKDDVVEQRRVKLGNASTGVQSIVHGLDKQDRVVVDGIQRIRPGTRVKPIKTEDKTENNPAITDKK